MKQFHIALAQLRRCALPVLVFELGFKLLTVAVIVPACAGLIQAAIRLAHLNYLTNSNLGRFFRSPWTYLLLLILLFVTVCYTVFEIGALTACYAQTRYIGLRPMLRRMIRSGSYALQRSASRDFWLQFLHILLLIPFIQFTALTGIFTMLGMPDFIPYYLTKSDLVLPLCLAAVLLCAAGGVPWLYADMIFSSRICGYRAACRASRRIVKGHYFSTLLSMLLWQLTYFLLLLLLFGILLGGFLLLTRHSEVMLYSRKLAVLKTMVKVLGWVFSFLSLPVYLAHTHALLLNRAEQAAPELPENSRPVRRSAKPFARRRTALLALLTVSAVLTLHLSFVVNLVRGRNPLSVQIYQNTSVTAHRGYSAAAPENTLYAFDAAIKAGCDYVEFDIQQTKDGVPVILHDSNLRRTTGLNKNIWEVSYDEIKDLDAGSWFDPMYANARIPTLAEALEFIDKRILCNIEIKPSDHTNERYVEDIADIIDAYGYEKSCYVTSFSYDALRRVKKAHPAIQTGYTMSFAYGRFYTLRYADAFSIHKTFVNASLVNEVHGQGKQVFAWTANSAAEIRSLQNMQVDNIISDDPDLALSITQRSGISLTLRTLIDYLIN